MTALMKITFGESEEIAWNLPSVRLIASPNHWKSTHRSKADRHILRVIVLKQLKKMNSFTMAKVT